jgi:hypothetical protein
MVTLLAREIFQQLLLQPHNNQTNVCHLKNILHPDFSPEKAPGQEAGGFYECLLSSAHDRSWSKGMKNRIYRRFGGNQKGRASPRALPNGSQSCNQIAP